MGSPLPRRTQFPLVCGYHRAGGPFVWAGESKVQGMWLQSKLMLSVPLPPQMGNGRGEDTSELQFQTCCCCEVAIKIIATSLSL